MQIETWAVEKLVPYARNPRKNDAQVDRMASAIREFGFRIPVLVKSDGTVIDGHLRLKAAQKLSMSEVPVIVADDLTEVQVKAFRILVNRSVSWADWDDDLLKLELEELQGMDFDLSLTGFDDLEINDLLAVGNEGLTDADMVPEAPEEPITKPGDLWILGNHRLLCGDSTKAEDVGRLLGQVKPLLMVTDPPYGVDYDPDWRNRVDRANGKPSCARAIGQVANDDRADWTESYTLFPGDVAYVWHPAGARQVEFYNSLVESGFIVRMQIIWAKNHFPIGRGNYHVQHEPCWYAVRKNGTGHWAGDRKQTTLWHIDKPIKSETGHSTQKPVECMKRPIENNSSPGQAVYDPFLGSGTTLIASEMTGRSCYGIEIEPKYCDVIVKRWEDFTGKKALLQEGQRYDGIGKINS